MKESPRIMVHSIDALDRPHSSLKIESLASLLHTVRNMNDSFWITAGGSEISIDDAIKLYSPERIVNYSFELPVGRPNFDLEIQHFYDVLPHRRAQVPEHVSENEIEEEIRVA